MRDRAMRPVLSPPRTAPGRPSRMPRRMPRLPDQPDSDTQAPMPPDASPPSAPPPPGRSPAAAADSAPGVQRDVRDEAQDPAVTARTRRLWIGLVVLLCAIEAVLLLSDLRLLGSPRWRSLAYQNGAFWSGLLRGWTPNYTGQPIAMFVTYAFLHADWQHVLGNSVTLVWLGRALGDRCGPGRFAQFYMFSVLGGGLGFGLLSASAAPMVGASGAIMGLIGVWIAWDARDMQAVGWPPRRVAVATGARCALLLLLNLVMLVLLHGLLAWETHLGGFLAGALAGWLMRPEGGAPERM